MKRKSAKATDFLDGLHESITHNRQFRRDTRTKSELVIQGEIRPLILRYLEEYFAAEGYADAVRKAHNSFYWEGQEGQFGEKRPPTFGARNYPDFIITNPRKIAVEYKQSQHGSTVKQGIGQSIIHTLSGDFEFVYYLFHDENKDKRIEKSMQNPREAGIIERMWREFNVRIKFV